ncbi:MAG TPA: monovalent cation:proton antiporter-2 (CPA2) family protein [Polyangiaceae bacterium]|nr:monovalent cation:proton antiporter-2 (CPA2) family protein [Polyangiaceae bacterium]
MHAEGFFFQAFVYLAAAVVAVVVAKRLGLGSVLGYLLAGAAIGPFGLGLVGREGADVMHFAEFGAVMMLFAVGLELEPKLLWQMRTPILGLGGAQVAATSAAAALACLPLGLRWKEAVAIGLVVSLSSTAIVLQSLEEKGLLRTTAGRSAFAVLLFQDIAVIPMLAVFPLLASRPAAAAGGEGAWVESLPAPLRALVVLSAIAAIVVGGHYAMGPAFRLVAKTRLRELFTAAALLLVIGIALLMQAVGMSPALGAFVAGVVLAGSEFRHELEGDIEPFKGLLLGLFFLAVGASIDFRLVAARPGATAAAVGALVVGKAALLYGLGRAFRLSASQATLVALSLAQVGEFAFVLLSFAAQHGVLDGGASATLTAAVALSMALTPLVLLLGERAILPRLGAPERAEREADPIDHRGAVIIAGFGRFGQIVARYLRAAGVRTTVLEDDSDQVELLRRFGHEVYYGDATRLDLLRAAGAAEARALVVAIDGAEERLALVKTARKHFPRLAIFARASGRVDAYDLIDAGVTHVYRETFDTALRAAADALRALGARAHRAHRLAQNFRRYDEQNLRAMAEERSRRDRQGFLDFVRAQTDELERLLQNSARERGLVTSDDAWDDATLRDEIRRGAFVVHSPDEAAPAGGAAAGGGGAAGENGAAARGGEAAAGDGAAARGGEAAAGDEARGGAGG